MAFDDVRPEGVVTEDGFEVEYRFEHDSDSGPPWANPEEDAPLMRYGRRHLAKRSCERPILSHRGEYYFFNWQLASKRARAEKWNAEPLDAPDPVTRSVQQLFDYYKAYINEDWHYVGIEVRLKLHPQYRHDVWGFETYKDYHKESVKELASELVGMYFNDLANGRYKPKE